MEITISFIFHLSFVVGQLVVILHFIWMRLFCQLTWRLRKPDGRQKTQARPIELIVRPGLAHHLWLARCHEHLPSACLWTRPIAHSLPPLSQHHRLPTQVPSLPRALVPTQCHLHLQEPFFLTATSSSDFEASHPTQQPPGQGAASLLDQKNSQTPSMVLQKKDKAVSRQYLSKMTVCNTYPLALRHFDQYIILVRALLRPNLIRYLDWCCSCRILMNLSSENLKAWPFQSLR